LFVGIIRELFLIIGVVISENIVKNVNNINFSFIKIY